MNEQLQKFARYTLKEGLHKLNDNQIRVFKLMYSHKNLDLPINEVVDNIPDTKLDWAMTQVLNTLHENEKSSN